MGLNWGLNWVLQRRRFEPEFSLSHNITSLACKIVFLLSLLLVGTVAHCSPLLKVTVTGVDGPLHKNIMARLTINLHKENPRLQAGGIRRLHRQADADIRSALAPYGYYNPVITGKLERDGESFNASYSVDKGAAVIVSEVEVTIAGSGSKNKRLFDAAADFQVKKGDILNQDLYEKGKKKLTYLALSEGFLDAAFVERALRVNRETNVASVHLVLDSGRQYLFGRTSSSDKILDDDLLQRYLPYKKGDLYDSAKLFELQSILYRTDYFKRVVVEGNTERAEGQEIPVEIQLTPLEYNNKYSLGVGYATDTGFKGKVDWNNRLFNSKGHKMSGSFQLAELENIIFLRYDIPRADPRYNRLVQSFSYQDKKWDDTDTQLLTVAVSHEYAGPQYSLSGGLELRDEVYDVGNTSGESTLLVPSLKAGMVWADDVLNTKNGMQASVGFLGGLDGLISDATFLQATVNGKAIISPLKDWRLIGRGSLGITLVDSIDSLPPSLRFYTGGDGTIRGYSYKSIGTKDSSGAVIGGRYLVVGSIEMERLVSKNWSLAAFWDVGTATDDLSLDFSQGAGAGLRYRLPFGQIRLDFASGFTEEDRPFRMHLTVGGDL